MGITKEQTKQEGRLRNDGGMEGAVDRERTTNDAGPTDEGRINGQG
jgi:hypothetical protein